MKIEIDVSGSDIFHKNYSICVSDCIGHIRGFKFSEKLIDELNENWKKKKYNKCPYSSVPGRFKVRIYRVVLRYLLKELFEKNEDEDVIIQFYKDFPGHERGISQSITHRVVNVHKRKLKRIFCEKLPKKSDAHCYALMIHNDRYNYLTCYSKISLKDIEHGLIYHINNNFNKK